ncbi:MAG: helix-turn-helix domain-containing protein [Sphingomonas sp.]|nr:helix-turn-helix domain-containing protein [Sphingomonas sp.]
MAEVTATTDQSRLARLNERQKSCLRLYYQGLEAKEIARELGNSPNTVNQHLRDARRILGVARSVQAARLLAEAEGHNRVGTDPRRIAAADRADQMAGVGSTEASAGPARKNRYRLSTLQRFGLIIAIAFLAVALGGALLAAAETITRVLRSAQIDLSDPPYRK